MKEIRLTKNKIAFVDDEDFEIINRYKWFANWNGYGWYSGRKSYDCNGKKITVYMHRMIMSAPKYLHVDHKNGNSLDNRKENLRLCTNQENHYNIKNPLKTNKLGIKGVRLMKGRRKFSAAIRVCGKNKHLGYFNVLGDADSAYRIAEEKYFGEFARNA